MTLVETPNVSLRDLVRRGRLRLRQAGIANADLDARVLALAAAGARHADLVANGDAPVDASAPAAFDRFVGRRAAREPVARILGRREFWSLGFEVTGATLDPRGDSETVIEAALELARGVDGGDGIHTICDLGTGTGCLLLALLTEVPAACGIGVDICPKALRVARHNAAAHGLAERASFLCADWTAGLAGGFDLIVSNPPYVRSADIATLEPEVRDHDPCLALDGGADGLDAYRRMIAGAHAIINRGGWLMVEVGAGQAAEVKALMRAAGFRLDTTADCIVRDLAGIERCVRAQA